MASNLKEKSDTSYEGGCFCNAIKFTVTADTFWSILCYCKSCTKISGAPVVAWAGFVKNQIHWTGEQICEFSSSKGVKRGFCKKCGASIFFKMNKSNIISISAGLFDKSLKLKTNRNIFTKNRLKYYSLDRDIPKFSRHSKQ